MYEKYLCAQIPTAQKRLAALGSARLKAARKMLAKLTIGVTIPAPYRPSN